LLVVWFAALAGLRATGGEHTGLFLSALQSEAVALEALRQPSFSLPAVESADVEQLVHRGWHSVVREIVLLGHGAGEEESQRVATQVRQAVQMERNKLDDLIRILDRNYGKAAEVSPAAQWAQNSTHVFLAIKFAQRWNAPGALEVENETVSISSCCFNFTAFGEHSFIRRRYHLSFELFRAVVLEASSWSLASVGRMSVTLAKAKAANWPRLLSGPSAAPKNLGIWRDMKEKWHSELQKFPPLDGGAAATTTASKQRASAGKPSKEKTKMKKNKVKDQEENEEDDDALDREVELLSECPKASYSGTPVAELCGKAWSEAVEEPRVKRRRWLVELYSSQGDGNLESMKQLMPVWKRLADVFPSMVPGGRVGSLDCGHDKDFCRKLGIPMAKLPQIWRFSGGGDRVSWTGGLGASIEELATFGGGGGGHGEF